MPRPTAVPAHTPSPSRCPLSRLIILTSACSSSYPLSFFHLSPDDLPSLVLSLTSPVFGIPFHVNEPLGLTILLALLSLLASSHGRALSLRYPKQPPRHRRHLIFDCCLSRYRRSLLTALTLVYQNTHRSDIIKGVSAV